MRFASISRANGSLGRPQASIVGASSRMHRPLGLAGAVARVELRLELVERGQPVALPLVAEDVDEPREAVDRPQVRPVLARKEQRRDGEVLRPRAGRHRSNVHRQNLDVCRISTGPLPTKRRLNGTVSPMAATETLEAERLVALVLGEAEKDALVRVLYVVKDNFWLDDLEESLLQRLLEKGES